MSPQAIVAGNPLPSVVGILKELRAVGFQTVFVRRALAAVDLIRPGRPGQPAHVLILDLSNEEWTCLYAIEALLEERVPIPIIAVTDGNRWLGQRLADLELYAVLRKPLGGDALRQALEALPPPGKTPAEGNRPGQTYPTLPASQSLTTESNVAD